MTTERRTTIEPSDIQALELECLKCHGKQTVLLDNWLNTSGRCSNCQEQWPIGHARAFQSLMQLTTNLAEIAKVKGNPDLPFSVRFVLAGNLDKAQP